MGFLDDIRETDRQVNGYGSNQGMNGYGNNQGMNEYGSSQAMNGYGNYQREIPPAGSFLEQIRAEIGETPENAQARKNEQLIQEFMEELRMIMLSKVRSRDYKVLRDGQRVVKYEVENLRSFKKLFPYSHRVVKNGFFDYCDIFYLERYTGTIEYRKAEQLFEELKVKAGLDGIFIKIKGGHVEASISLPE